MCNGKTEKSTDVPYVLKKKEKQRGKKKVPKQEKKKRLQAKKAKEKFRTKKKRKKHFRKKKKFWGVGGEGAGWVIKHP